MSIHPYLFFSGGTCRAALTRYQEVLGGELEIMPASAAPEGQGMPGADPDAVMHGSLALPGGALLMASDDPTGTGGGVQGVALNWTTTDEAEAERVFAALAEGGQVDMPMEATFWAARFGMCRDRWGVAWMVSADPS